MKKKQKNDMASLLEVCRSLESCHKVIVSINPSTPFKLTLDQIIANIDDAVFDLATILGDDDPERMSSILNEIEYAGTRSNDHEI